MKLVKSAERRLTLIELVVFARMSILIPLLLLVVRQACEARISRWR